MEVWSRGCFGEVFGVFLESLGVLLDLLEQRWGPVGGMWVISGMLWGTRAGGSYALECFWQPMGSILEIFRQCWVDAPS